MNKKKPGKWLDKKKKFQTTLTAREVGVEIERMKKKRKQYLQKKKKSW